MQIQVAAENNQLNNWLNKHGKLYLFCNDKHKHIYPVLFLLLLFYNEAGNAFVESPLNRTTKINIKNPGQKAGILVFPQPLKGSMGNIITKIEIISMENSKGKLISEVSSPFRGRRGRISIQGYEGSFHQEATRQFFGKDVEVIPCATFREVVKLAGNKKESDGGVMAIENSIAGSILPNYNLLQKSGLKIIGEVYLLIKQNLLVNPGVKLEDIKEVHSHTMALQQCYDFLDQHKWKLVETEDTALSAKHIHQYKSKHVAAIASKLAAELFELEIIAPNIHTVKNNYTRFLVLQREDAAIKIEDADKASVNFQTDHSKGSLAKVLTKIAEGGINLSKLQSFPIPGTDFKYSFHADMEFDSAEQFDQVIEVIKPLTAEIKIYGVYKRGIWK